MQYSKERRDVQTEVSYSYAQAAEILGVSVNTMRCYVSRGLVKVYRWPGSHPRVPASEIGRLSGSSSFSYKEAAQIIGIAQHTLRNWVWQGRVDSIRVPAKGVRIPRSALEILPHCRPIPDEPMD